MGCPHPGKASVLKAPAGDCPMRFAGTVRQGQGHAAANYERMIAAAAVHYPAVADCGRFGTINVRLDQPLDKGRADCWTPRLVWKPVEALGGDREEEFGFVEIKLEYPISGRLQDAWIIYPSGHQATYVDPYLVEVIAADLIGGERLAPGSLCAVHLEHVPPIVRPSSFGDNFPHAPSLW